MCLIQVLLLVKFSLHKMEKANAFILFEKRSLLTSKESFKTYNKIRAFSAVKISLIKVG